MRKLGCQPAARRISASIDEVVVLPWLPATATVVRVATMARSASARRSTGMPRSRAATTSGLLSGIAVEITTASSAVGQVLGGVADVRGDVEEPEAFEGRRLAQVGAAHGVAHAREHGGDRAHARAAHADDVDRVRLA